MTHTPDRSLTRRGLLARAGAVSAVALSAPPVLAACSGGSSGGTDADVVGDADYKQGSASLKVELSPEIDGVNYPEGYKGPKARTLEPFADGSTEFTMLTRTIPGLDYSTNYYAQYLEEVTGVKVKYEPVPLGDDGQTKVNAILSAGDLPHALMTGMGLFSVSQISVYGQQGLFLPVDKLIDEHAPHIRDMFDTFPDMRSLFTSPDGRIYAVPAMNDCFHCKSEPVRTWYNQSWLDAVGASVPETLEDFDALLEEWKTWSDLPKNAALVLSDSDSMMRLFNFFQGSFLPNTTTYTAMIDGKVTWLPTQDAYREGMIWIQEQFAKGNFHQGILSLTNDQLKQYGDDPNGPRFGITTGGSQGTFTANTNMADDTSAAVIMKPLPPMAGPNGVRTSDWLWYQIGSPNFVITNSCPDPVTMIRWADYQYELATTVSMGRGERGTGWDWADTDQQGIDGKAAVYQVIPENAELENQVWWEWGPSYKSMDQRHGEAVLEGGSSIEPSLYEAGKAYEPYQVPKEQCIPTLAYDMDQSAEIGELRTNLEQYLQQSYANLATGKVDFTKDADWKAYTEKFESIGLARALEIEQAAYDQQY